MTNINTYTVAGTKSSMNLPKILQEKININLLAQALRVYQDRSHPGLSKVKTRSEINLTTAKVWRQKGTGRARHGARSAPIFVGGGVAHGPKGIKRTLKMSQKMAKKSLFVALSLKAKNNELVVVSDLSKIKKTSDAKKLIDLLIAKENLKKRGSVSVLINHKDVQTRKAFRNLKNTQVLDVEKLNTFKVYWGGLLIFEKEAFETFIKSVSVVKKTDKMKKSIKKTESIGSIEKENTKSAGKTNKKVKKTVKTSSKKGSK